MNLPRQTQLIAALLTVLTNAMMLSAHGEQTSTAVDLEKVKLGHQVQVIDEGGQTLLRIEGNSGERPRDIHLFDIEQPAISGKAYALAGEIRYKNVAGHSYLETWNHFAPAGGDASPPMKFFTRALNHTGPMAVISANSDWRPFQLPFFINAADSQLETKPSKITFNLHLEGAGLVEIRNVELVDGLDAADISHPRPLPKPWEILVFLAIVIGVMASLTAIAVANVRRKNRKAEKLRQIRAKDA